MKNRLKILPAVCSIALLSACASHQSASMSPLNSATSVAASSSKLSPDALYKMGRYYQGQNRFDLAVNAYQKALAADNSFVEARNGLGVVYSRQGKYREAIEAFQVAVKQAPKAAHLYSNMGYAYYLQGDYAASVTALEQATLLDPANQLAFNNLGLAYAKAGHKGESVQAFAQAVNVPAAVPNITVTEIAARSQGTEPVNSAIAAVSAEANAAPAPQPEVQILALPKDRGVIRPAPDAGAVEMVDSRVTLVKLAPNVTELRIQPQRAEPEQVTTVADAMSPEKLRVEVANGNGVTGAAGKVGQFLRSQGYPAARLTNQKPFQVRVTQIQYREGYQAEAQFLQASLPNTYTLVKRSDMRAGVGVRLVLGKDMVTQLAQYEFKDNEYQHKAIQLAANATRG